MSRNSLRLSEVLVISRPFWWVTTAVPFLVGALLTTGKFDWRITVGFVFFLIPYNLMLYGVNDIFDYESDIKNPRKNGGIHGSVLSKRKHPALWRVMAWTNIPFILFLLATGNFIANFFLIIIVYMVFAYSVAGLRFKETAVLDSLTSAFHYTAPFMFAILYFRGEHMWVGAFAAFYLWAAAQHALGAIRDIEPDREAGISSIATKFGARRTLYFCILLYALAVLALALEYQINALYGVAALAPYALVVLRCLAVRRRNAQARYIKAWNQFMFLNYFVGGCISVSLLYLYNK